jgi:hypothetical protein
MRNCFLPIPLFIYVAILGDCIYLTLILILVEFVLTGGLFSPATEGTGSKQLQGTQRFHPLPHFIQSKYIEERGECAEIDSHILFCCIILHQGLIKALHQDVKRIISACVYTCPSN